MQSSVAPWLLLSSEQAVSIIIAGRGVCSCDDTTDPCMYARFPAATHIIRAVVRVAWNATAKLCLSARTVIE